MVVDTGVIVAGTGYAGSAVLRRLAEPDAQASGSRDPEYNAAFILLDKAHGEMLVDLILSERGEVAGALVAREGRIEPVRAPAVVLATGGIQGLLPGGDWRLSGDGLALAHRAGLALSRPVLERTPEGETRLHAGVPCKPDGTTALRGLLVAGSLGADRPDPERVARAAVMRSREGPEPFGPYHQRPAIDEPLPKGFAHVKFERLRALCDRALRAPELAEPERQRILAEIHRLKGEADEYARARCDLELLSLQNACEVALLLLRME